MALRNRPTRSRAPKRPGGRSATPPWRHALQDLEPLIGFANLRPKDPSEFEEAITSLVAPPAPGSKRLHNPASIALLKALGCTAFNAPVRLAELVLVDPKQESWRNANARKRALTMIFKLRECTARILDRLVRGSAVLVNGVVRPELHPRNRRIDFVVNGRDPIDIMTFGPTPQFRLPIVYDIQDALFLKIRNLIDRVQRPARLRWENGTVVPFWPLASCLVCGHFYFQSRSNRTTCSRRCTQRWDHTRRQRTVRDLKTGKHLRQHNLRVTITAVPIQK
jgi:hypothetical protein